MTREPIEVRFVFKTHDYVCVDVQRGIYLFDDMTLAELLEFAKMYRETPDWIEIGVNQNANGM